MTRKLNIHNIFAAMSSVKRKALESKLNRRVRARRVESEELVEESENESAPPSEEGASGSEDEGNASGDESRSGDEDVRACSSARNLITNVIVRAIRRGPNPHPKTTPSLTKLEPSPSAH